MKLRLKYRFIRYFVKFCRKAAAKSQEKQRNSFALFLHSTVSHKTQRLNQNIVSKKKTHEEHQEGLSSKTYM